MRAVVYSATRNFYDKIRPAIRSMQEATDPDRIYLLAEDDQLPIDLPGVEIINVSGQPWFDMNGPNIKTRYSWIVLLRAAMTKIFPDLHLILSVDADTICREDVSDLWELDMDPYYFAGCREWAHERLYVNAGVLLLNLDKLRDGTDDQLIRALNKRSLRFPEQDCINETCAGMIRELPPEYNACDFTDHCDRPRIVHFAYRKEWWNYPEVKAFDH